MTKSVPPTISWLPDVEEHRYPAAASYLGLIHPEQRVAEIVTALRAAPVVQFQSKDIFRASRLSLLGVSNARVERDRQKIRKGEPLSPLLLLRDEAHGTVVVADGYHRLCAVYGVDEDTWIHCKIV
jgi:disulfide oxidoreductase YuzD